MNRFNDAIEILAAPLPTGAKPPDRSKLVLTKLPHRQFRDFFLGTAAGAALYGYLRIYDFVELEKKLPLAGGDDVLAAIIRGMNVTDTGNATANGCEMLLGEEAPAALPTIDKAIADHLPEPYRFLRAMHVSKDPAVTGWLKRLTGDSNAEIATAARETLLQSPRTEAADLYAKWLADGAGKRPRLSRACSLPGNQAPGCGCCGLPTILATPASVLNYQPGLGDVTRACRQARHANEPVGGRKPNP